MPSSRFTCCALLLALGACSSPGPAGGPDASSNAADAATGDAGSVDAGPFDAGGADAGSGDAGSDAGIRDGGMTDAGPANAQAPAVACVDSLANVYVTPANLPPLTDAGRGDIVRCAFDFSLTPGQVRNEVSDAGVTTAMPSGTNIYRIAYRTVRGNGSPGVSTARVYLPAVPRPLPMPLIAVGHPTTGLAQMCTPSENPASSEDLSLPWAGQGYAVIIPDYAGTSNGGAQGYLDNHDQAYSLLDGARALRKMLTPGVFNGQILAVGLSQGGGTVLSAQALAGSYGADGQLVGVIAFAPEWPSRMNSFGLVNQLQNPTELTILTGFAEDVISVMRSYSYFYNYVGPTHADDGFPAAARAGIDSTINSQCEIALGGYLQATAVHVGDITDPALGASLLACIEGTPDGGCVDPGKSYYAFLQNNIVHADPNGAPILYVQGALDIVMPPGSEAACNIDALLSDGVTPQVCFDQSATHTSVAGLNADFAIRWATALFDGGALPQCSALGLPSCTP